MININNFPITTFFGPNTFSTIKTFPLLITIQGVTTAGYVNTAGKIIFCKENIVT